MPLYEYKCPDCGLTKDIWVTITGSAKTGKLVLESETDELTCECGQNPMQRVYGFATTNMPTGAGVKMKPANPGNLDTSGR